jgi:hypothetical protein
MFCRVYKAVGLIWQLSGYLLHILKVSGSNCTEFVEYISRFVAFESLTFI